MLLKIYLIGLISCLIWWIIFAFLVFEKRFYDNSDEKTKKSIDEMLETLQEFDSLNPQVAYVLMSLIISVFWFIIIPYMFIKKIINKF